MLGFERDRHPHIDERSNQGPVKVAEQLPQHNSLARFNSWLGLRITVIVGTMFCAYAFATLALVSLPTSFESGNPVVIVGWVAQTFLQLILLPIIIVGQNIQAKASDLRSEQTFLDAEAILKECAQLHEHLTAQDAALMKIVESFNGKASP